MNTSALVMNTEQTALLEKYIAKQNKHLTNALFEISVCGYKRTHWCWYFFPNMPGLGISERATEFALDLDTYMLFLSESIEFRRNIFTMMVAVDTAYRNSNHMNLEVLLGDNPVDVLKWKSFLTLTWYAFMHLDFLNDDWTTRVQNIIRYGMDVYGLCPKTVERYKRKIAPYDDMG